MRLDADLADGCLLGDAGDGAHLADDGDPYAHRKESAAAAAAALATSWTTLRSWATRSSRSARRLLGAPRSTSRTRTCANGGASATATWTPITTWGAEPATGRHAAAPRDGCVGRRARRRAAPGATDASKSRGGAAPGGDGLGGPGAGGQGGGMMRPRGTAGAGVVMWTKAEDELLLATVHEFGLESGRWCRRC